MALYYLVSRCNSITELCYYKNAGVCAYMNAILVNKLVEFGSKGSAESFGFTVEKPSDEYFPESAGDEEIPI